MPSPLASPPRTSPITAGHRRSPKAPTRWWPWPPSERTARPAPSGIAAASSGGSGVSASAPQGSPAGVFAERLIADLAGLDLSDCLVEDRHSLVNLGLGDDKGRSDLHDIRIDAAVENDQPQFEGAHDDLRHLVVGRLLGGTVADGFQAQHHPQTAHVADEGVTLLEFAEPIEQIAPSAIGPAN